jgi:hypothetical protein
MPSLKDNPKFCQDIYMVRADGDAVELHLSRLIMTATHPDMQKIRINGFFFKNRLHWQFEVRLLLFTVCTCA